MLHAKDIPAMTNSLLTVASDDETLDVLYIHGVLATTISIADDVTIPTFLQEIMWDIVEDDVSSALAYCSAAFYRRGSHRELVQKLLTSILEAHISESMGFHFVTGLQNVQDTL